MIICVLFYIYSAAAELHWLQLNWEFLGIRCTWLNVLSLYILLDSIWYEFWCLGLWKIMICSFFSCDAFITFILFKWASRITRWRRDSVPTAVFLGFLVALLVKNLPAGGSGSKEFTCLAGDLGFDPWVGKMPWRGARLPTLLVWPGETHGLYSPWCQKESDTTAGLSLISCKH